MAEWGYRGENMKTINTKQILKDFEGKALKNGEHDLDVGTVIGLTLSGKVSNPTLAYMLAKQVSTKDTVELKAEDIAFIKKELEASEFWMAIATGQVIEILETEDKK